MPRTVNAINMVRVPDEPGHRFPRLSTVSAFFFKMIYRLSFHGLPCPCCDGDSTDIHPPPRMLSTCIYEDGKRRVCFCPHCDAMLCDSCANRISQCPQLQEAQCKWCTGTLHPINRQVLTYEQQRDPSFQLYSRAQKNITGILRDWMNAMYKTHLGDYLSRNFWTPVMETIGWRFFVGLDFLVETQHRRQFKLLMSSMEMRKRHQRPQRRLHDSSYAKFKRMPESEHVVYKECRTNALNRSLSKIVISKLSKKFPSPKCFSIFGEYVSSEFAKNLAVGLGICQINPRKQKRQVRLGDEMSS